MTDPDSSCMAMPGAACGADVGYAAVAASRDPHCLRPSRCATFGVMADASSGPAGRSEPNLLSDDPRDGSAERPDELGREEFAEYLASLIDTVRSQSESSVMALIGDWGSGKSTILELLRKQLTSSRGWLLAEFNPWTYANATSLQRGFFAELTRALPKGQRPSSARARVGDFARTISPVGKIGGLVGVDAEGVLNAVAEVVSGDTSPSAAKRAAEAALRRIRRPVLMVIDDLDRLTPDELLEVLKLVRLVGRLPHVYYLLAYDERTLLDVLGATALAANDERRARAYLEKIVQVRLDMPLLRASQREDLLDRGLTSILRNNQIALTRADQQRLSEVYFAVLDRRLSTPRAITRFLGQVQAFLPPLRREVDFVDFFLVSWLRTQEPGVYSLLQRERDTLLGRSLNRWSLGRRDAAAAEERRNHWEQMLVAADVDSEDMNGVVRVLSALFPEVQATFAGTHAYTTAGERATPKAVSSPDYFDRYFSFGVPHDDFPDSILDQALADLQSSVESDAVRRLEAELRNNAARALRKIEVLRDAGVDLPEQALFEFIGRAWPGIPEDREELFVVEPRRAAERSAGRGLLRMDPATASATASRVAQRSGGTDFVINAVRWIRRDSRSQYGSSVPAEYDLSPLLAVAQDALERWQASNPAPSPFDDGVMSRFWTWVDLDEGRAHAWLRGRVEAGDWSLEETMGALTSVAVSIGDPDRRTSIGEFQVAVADAVFGLDEIFKQLADRIEAAPPLAGDTFSIPATPENRIGYALWALQRARRERAVVEGEPGGDAAEG